MEHLLLPRFTWTQLIGIGILLFVLYWGLRMLLRLLESTRFLGRLQPAAVRMLRYLNVVFEPLAILIFLLVFVFINPPLHGLLVGLLLLLGFRQLRNYLSGRLVQNEDNIIVGKVLKTSNLQGIVSKMGRLGLHLQTSDGLHFINYQRLLDDGYTLISGEEVGGFYKLILTPQSSDKQAPPLRDLLVTTPYVDWQRPPRLHTNGEDDRTTLEVLLKEEGHLQELIDLIREWGYGIRVVN